MTQACLQIAAQVSSQMLGEMLVKDHSTHLDKVKTLATVKECAFYSAKADTSFSSKIFVTSKSPDLCYTFAQFEIEDHKNEIANEEDEMGLGDDVYVVLFAQKTNPTL